MNSKTIKLMLALCLLLIIVLFIEWQILGGAEDQVVETNLLNQEDQNDEKQLSAVTLSKLPIASYADMVDKPLFIQGRRSVSGVVENIGQQGSKIEDLTLVGIYSVKDLLVAAFSNQKAEKKFVKISTNDDISGWKVKEVQLDKVVLEKAGKQQTLLLRARKEKAPAKPKAKSKKVAQKRTKPIVKPKSTTEKTIKPRAKVESVAEKGTKPIAKPESIVEKVQKQKIEKQHE